MYPTPRQVTVQARIDFEYRGQAFRVGEMVPMAAIDAVVGYQAGWIRLSPIVRDIPTAPVAADAASSAEGRRRRRREYQRRDLTAEP